ncbi:hypothetical protein [Pantanalinema sp. GBBB05]|uniref:hypothetical protein n=1 Tax=Pantanalinema sp. GBBB05 TaxID=2604139 RepID=UPI001D538D6D|nr:hypothetical protein [Pantanalinema sp. GBBB05]
MLTQHRKSVCVSLTSADLPICSELETVATLYQHDHDRFHLVLTEPLVLDRDPSLTEQLLPAVQPLQSPISAVTTPRLLWLEFSPYRATLTMQGNGQFSYRHLFQLNMFGSSRYWLAATDDQPTEQFCLHNFTRFLHLKGNPLPRFLMLEYELWSEQELLGSYLFTLEIQD